MTLDVNKVLKWMQLFEKEIQDHRQLLIELDTPIGDSDHGSNMARGTAAMIAALEENTPETVADVFKTVAMQLISKVGGAAGPLYGSAFMGMAQAVSKGSEDWGEILTTGLENIQKRGKASVGEKTMVDVWSPVIEAVKDHQLTTTKIDEAVEATKAIKATKGRASYVGDRSIGHIDPGSYSSGLLFKTMLEAEVLKG